MYPPSVSDLWLCYLSGALILVALIWRKLAGDADGDAEERLAPWALHFIWAAAVVKIMMIVLAVRTGYVTMWGDDGSRFGMTLAYRQHFNIGPGDHVWLGGPFNIVGGLMRLVDEPIWAVLWAAMTFSVGSILAAAAVVWMTTRSAAGAVASAWIIASIPMHTWLSVGMLTGVPLSFITLTPLACGVAAWHRFEEEKRGWWALMLLAGFLATVGTSYRYEGWMFLAGYGALAWLHFAWTQFAPEAWRRKLPITTMKKPGHRYALLLAAATVISFVYPMMWAWASWRDHGDPTYFLKLNSSLNHNMLDRSFVERLTHYPLAILRHLRPVTGLALAGAIVGLTLWRSRPRAFFVTLVLLGYLAMQITLVVLNGTGSALDRYTLGLTTVLMPLAGMALVPVGELLSDLTGGKRLAAAALLLLIALPVVVYTKQSATGMNKYKWWGFRNETFIAGFLISQELHEPQMFPALARGGDVLLWSPGPMDSPTPSTTGIDTLLPALLMNTQTDRILFAAEDHFPEELKDRVNLAVIQIGGEDKSPPARFHLVGTLSNMRLYSDVVEEKAAE